MAKRKYTKEFLEPLVRENTSVAGIIRSLGLSITGGNHRGITQRIKEYGLDTSHFTGQGWSKGKTKETDASVKKVAFFNKTPDEEVFILNSGYSCSKLGQRLRELGWVYKCKKCKLDKWKGEKITLHVDHINGDHTDNRLFNLRFLCPNCHQQTKTWGNKDSPERKEEKRLALENKLKEKQGRKIKPIRKCVDCGKKISRISTRCRSCAVKKGHLKSLKRPEKEILEESLVNFNGNLSAVGRHFGVSDNAVRKWKKYYNI